MDEDVTMPGVGDDVEFRLRGSVIHRTEEGFWMNGMPSLEIVTSFEQWAGGQRTMDCPACGGCGRVNV